MKKFLAFLLLTAMVFPVTGCDLDEILTASNPSSVSENSFSTSTENDYDLPSDISSDSDSAEESDFPEESESSSSVSSSSFVYPDDPSDSSEISTTMTEPEESVESTISTFPDESSYSSSSSSKSSTTRSSASNPSSTSTKSSTSKPDFPGSDYQAYLDGTMVVYIASSGNGMKYHRTGTCSKMNINVIAMTVSEARSRGYGPCQKKECFKNWTY